MMAVYGSTKAVSADEQKNASGRGIFKRAFQHIQSVRVEPVMAFYSLGYYMPSTFVQNLTIDKSCFALYSHNICRSDNMTFGNSSTDIETKMQEMASQYLLYYNLMQNIPSLILTLFLGHWSDLHGRKLAIILPMIGSVISNIFYILIYLNDSWPASYIIWAAAPSGFTGSSGVFMMSFYGWVRDVYPLKGFALRVAIADGIEAMGLQLSSLIGAQLYEKYGYVAVFVTSSVFTVVAFLFAFVNVKDSIYASAKWQDLIKDFFQVKSLLKNFTILTVPRKDRKRCYLLVMCIVTFIGYYNYGGSDEISYLYARLRVHWDAVTFSYYNMAQTAFIFIGCFVTAPLLMRWLKFSDITVAVIGHVAVVIFHIGTAFATSSFQMFAVCLMMTLGSLVYITFRAMISKLIAHEEMGKLMAINALIQTIASNIGRIVATRIYMVTLTTFPGVDNVSFAALYAISILLFCFMKFDMMKHTINLGEE